MKESKRRLIKFIVVLLVLACVCGIFALLPRELTNKDDVIRLYRRHEDKFLQAAESSDFLRLERIKNVQSVYKNHSGNTVYIYCGGSGFGPNTSYYGIFYSKDFDSDNYRAGTTNRTKQDDGYLFREITGDNWFYVEPLGNDYYYYEEHY